MAGSPVADRLSPSSSRRVRVRCESPVRMSTSAWRTSRSITAASTTPSENVSPRRPNGNSEVPMIGPISWPGGAHWADSRSGHDRRLADPGRTEQDHVFRSGHGCAGGQVGQDISPQRWQVSRLKSSRVVASGYVCGADPHDGARDSRSATCRCRSAAGYS